jgi:hydrogenase-4 component F
MMMGFGLLSMLVAVFSMLRRKDVKRLFAYSSIEHMGIATFAFGLGGALATFAALLHMTVHSLTKSSIFFSVGHATQINGTQQMSQIKGLLKRMPRLGWGLLLGSFAILGMPPFGVFASEFIVLTVAMKQVPWTTPILLLCLAVAFGVIFFRVGNMVLGEGVKENLSHPPALFPVFLHLALVLVLGIFIPPFLAHWYQNASRFIG